MQKHLFELAKTPLGEFIVGVAFGKLSKLLPIKRIKETERVLAFWHPKPYWEEHILLVPKKAIRSLAAANPEDIEYISEIFAIAQEIVTERGWQEKDFTIITNGGTRQEVAQLHFHLARGSVKK